VIDVKNDSDEGFRIVNFSRKLPTEVREEIQELELWVPPHKIELIVTFLETNVPGKYENKESAITLEHHTKFFRQHLRLADNVVITARPVIGGLRPLMGMAGQGYLIIDPNRRGTGTDLAAIKPVNSLGDLHCVDWKATARTGKLMAREFYLEREPSIMLMIDTVSLRRPIVGKGPPTNTLLREVANFLLTPQIVGSIMGLILYDEHSVVVNIEARSGIDNKENMLRALLEVTMHPTSIASRTRQEQRSYASLSNDIRILTRELAFSERLGTLNEQSKKFAQSILPFYEEARSRYNQNVRLQGVFKAFEIVRDLPPPMLIIANTDNAVNLDGLHEGAMYASMSNHQIIIAVLANPEANSMIETLSNLERVGVRVLSNCPLEELWETINNDILAMRRMRSILSITR
jgi:hypothetical protein